MRHVAERGVFLERVLDGPIPDRREQGRCVRFRLTYYVAVFVVAALMTGALWLASN